MSTRRKNRLSWQQALECYEISLRARRASPLTIKDYMKTLGHLHEHLRQETRRYPSRVSVTDLRAYQCGLLTGEASRSQRPLAAGSVAKATTIWRSFFRFLLEEGRLKTDPAARLESPSVPRRVPGEILSLPEVERLLNAPDQTTAAGLRDRAVVEVLFATGLRNAEVQALDLADLDHREREVLVRSGKGEKGRVVPLTRSAYERLAGYLERGRPDLQTSHPDSTRALFLSTRGRRINAQYLLRLLRKLAALAGIDRRLTPHSLRRTFASSLLKNGVSLRHIQVLLGHEHLNTTAVYLKLDRDELRRDLLLHHPRERFE